MTNARVVLLALLAMELTVVSPARGQSVVSTHSGLVYFFEGTVFIGDQQLEQRFGKFPDIGEGRDLRTERGRAEVLLTLGTVLRLDENSGIRMISDRLSDTRIEFLSGSAILESNAGSMDTSASLIYKTWVVKIPGRGVYQIDSEPPQLRVYEGEVEVSTEGKKEPLIVRDHEVLPLSPALVAKPATPEEVDDFKTWAMNRSQAIAGENAIGAKIDDEPNQTNTDGSDRRALSSSITFPPPLILHPKCARATWRWSCGADFGTFAIGVVFSGLAPKLAKPARYVRRIRRP
jgi:hypothetical protein